MHSKQSNRAEDIDAQTMKPEAQSFVPNTISSSEIFAIVQQLSSQVNDNRMPRVIDAVKDFNSEDKQMIVNLLSIGLEKHHHLLMNADQILNLLTEIASLGNVVARNRILTSDQFTSGFDTCLDVCILQGEPPSRVRVIKRGKKDGPEVFSKALLSWAHLSHPNILPVYGAFLDEKGGPVSLVSPWLKERNIVDHASTLPQVERMSLISDVIDGFCYLHHLGIVHGALHPLSVLISDSGQALVTDLDTSSDTSATRYLAPEVLKDEENSPTKAADVWALGCLCYEVLSGNVPFCQYRQERRVVVVVCEGKRPTRPGQEGVKGEEINDVTWRPVSACWEFEPEDRPSCLKLHDAFASMDICDSRPLPKFLVQSETLREIEAPAADLDNARSLLNRVLGSDQSLPPPSQIPEHLREPLSGLADSLAKVNTVAAAAKKLNPDDTQTLVDALDLILKENPSFVNAKNPITKLLHGLMTSTHLYPQRYRLRIRYDSSLVAQGSFGKVYKGRDLNICVNVVTDSTSVANIFRYVGLWAHSSHPNVLPFCGVFDEAVDEIPRFCLVSPYMKNGTLHDYAPRHPQNHRIPLISDIINGLGYLHTLKMYQTNFTPVVILISDEGRAMIASFTAERIVSCTPETKTIRSSTSYEIRFVAPEWVKTAKGSCEGDIWSFGCICYQVLSRKVPYHRYTARSEVRSALLLGEPPERPDATDNDIDVIEDQLWELIIGCCRLQPEDRLTISDIQKLLANLRIKDDRSDSHKLPSTAIMNLRKHPDIEWDRVKQLLGQIQVELLRNPLSRLIRSRIKDVAMEAVRLQHNDVQTLVDFLDMTLKNHHVTISDDRNRVLALLSRIMAFSQVFPQRHKLTGIKYDHRPIAEGGFGKVHRGLSDPSICVKVTTRVNDPHALIAYTRELIFWAHVSHPNVLPFYGVFFDDLQQMCLVSPYMTKGNLRNYAHQLPQKSRIPPLLDTIKGLDFLHGLGVVHTDLKGENVLISDEGRGLITDFGASHIITATANGGATSTPVSTTLRFTAPEVIQNQIRQMRPTKQSDIWSFGCLCYEVLSRKLPYYEYQLDAQVLAALFRGQLPKRPSFAIINRDDEYDDWDGAEERDWDDLDDLTWDWITKCLAPRPENRPDASRIQELIADMKAWDSRPIAKGPPGAEILKQKTNIEVNLNRAGALLDHLQILFLARSIYSYSDSEVVAAAAKLDRDDAKVLSYFFALVLNNHSSISGERNRILALHSAVVAFLQWFPAGYLLRPPLRYHPKIIGEGSFGKVYRGSELNICIKVIEFSQTNSDLESQWDRALVPWAHSSHPNILPFYGMSVSRGGFLVSAFIENGSLHNLTPGLSRRSLMLLVSDVIEGLMYLHKLGIIHGNLKTQNVLLSSDGRGMITDFRPYHVNVAAAVDGPTGPFITSTLRFTAPELVKDSQMLPTTASDVWSVGCLVYEVLSRHVPYYTYTQQPEIRAALSRGELLLLPVLVDGDTDFIDDQSWDLIMHCSALEAESRLTLEDVQDWLRKLELEDNRPAAKPLPGAEILKRRYQHSDVDILRVEEILDKLKAHLPTATQEGAINENEDSFSI